MLEKDVERVLLTQEEIEELLDGLAERINKDYNGRRLIAVGILDRKSTRLNSSHDRQSRMPSSA